MYALRYYGMFVRAKDGQMTENKSSAKLFETPEEAKAYAMEQFKANGVATDPSVLMELVEVETKPTISKVVKVFDLIELS